MSNPPDCPNCGAANVVPIAYGFPGPEMRAQVERGEIALGGCVIQEGNLQWRCTACGTDIGQTPHTGTNLAGLE